MSTKYTLQASPRKVTGRKVKQLRLKGEIPANLFGKDVKSVNLQINSKEFLKVHKEAGESTLIYLSIVGQDLPRPVMVWDVTVDPVSGQLLHTSFLQVNLKEKITAPVALRFQGTAPAETGKLGILVQQADELTIEALPADMPEHISVDLQGLIEVGNTIYAKDVKLDSKLILKSDPEAILAKIEPPAKEEAEVPATAEEVVTDQAQPNSDQSPKPAVNTT